MRSAAELKVIWRRLVSAIRRVGLLAVVRIVVITILRKGLVTTLRLANLRQPFRMGEGADEAEIRTGPVDLDPQYTMPAEDWQDWEPLVGVAPSASDRMDDLAEPALVTFVIDASGSPEAMASTRAAIERLGPTVCVCTDRVVRPSRVGEDSQRFFVFLKAGDRPSPALPQALTSAARGGEADIVSFDMWRTTGDPADERTQPLLLPGANPTLISAADYLYSRVALRGDALPDSFDATAPTPRDWMLAWLARRHPIQAHGRWRHVGRPLVHANITDEDIEAQRRVALDLARRPLPERPRAGATVVICTRDKGHLTRQLVRQLLAKPPEVVDEIVIVANGTANPYALQTQADLRLSPRVQILWQDEPFNFSRLSNAGVRASRGNGPVLLLNDDIAPVSEDWLERMAARLDDPGVGCVGPLLLYPDERVQHAGMYLGYKDTAGHILRAARLPEHDYLLTAVAPREVSALTGAAILTRRDIFEALGGLDEQLASHLQDVDYCLRVRAIGLANVFEPAAILIHMESASIKSAPRGEDFQRGRTAEAQRFTRRWGAALNRDPFHPPGFDAQDETLRRLTGPNGVRPKSIGGRQRRT